MKRSIGIVAHRSRPEALTFASEVIDWLKQRNISVFVDTATAEKLNQPALLERLGEVEFILTLGGDGTILTAARMAAPRGIPILGVHMGRFGFIAETHPGDLFPHLEEILAGTIRIEERMMIHAEIRRNGICVQSSYGLNEAVVKSGLSHLLQMKTNIGGEEFATYPADGMIVATPTGSTAYSLSAGGPIVAPTVEALLVVPICPHTLNARPLIIPCDEVIEVEIASDGAGVLFAVDGVDPRDLEDGDRIVVRRSDYVTHLIVLNHATFYRKVRNRYLYGERLNS